MQIICDNHKLQQLQIKQNTFVVPIAGIYIWKLLLVASAFTRAADSTFAVTTREAAIAAGLRSTRRKCFHTIKGRYGLPHSPWFHQRTHATPSA